MHYLIDGHNLIGQLADLDLADPDDELKLLVRLRRWTVADPRRQVTLFFDGGIFRGVARHLSDALITVIFSSRRQKADALIIKALRQLNNPQEFSVVTSDQEIRKAARLRRVPVIRAEEFAAALVAEAQARQRRPEPEEQKLSPKEAPDLSEAEIKEWLEAFGPAPQPARKPPRRRRAPATEPAAAPVAEPPRSADELKESGEQLREDEIAEWLALFGSAEPPDTEKKAPSRRRQKRVDPRPADVMKSSGGKLSQDEVDAWLDIFAQDPPESLT